MRDIKILMAYNRALELLGLHNLQDWSVSINGSRSALAFTDHIDKDISISKFFVYMSSKKQFDGVVLHEIAHALLGPGFGHGDEFLELCKKISPDDDYAKAWVDIGIRRYFFECPRCSYSGYHNSKSDKACPECYGKTGDTIVFNRKVNTVNLKMW